MRFLLLLLTGLMPLLVIGQSPSLYRQNKTLPYSQVLEFYQNKAKSNPQFKLFEYGPTDCGKPLQLFVISHDKDFDVASIRRKKKLIVLVNNGIHAGEPDGIDACIELVQKIDEGKLKLPEYTVLAIIPAYNIDGALIRGCCSRANQNGPEEYGFRANARYLDLNRDFIKMDSRNAEAFAELYHAWDPDIFIDTHVSNGADYQYNMTLIASQEDKLYPTVSKVMKQDILPALYDMMERKNERMVQYVNVFATSPDKGYEGFSDSPRYASGYSSLWNAFSFVTEAHMLKPYNKRVEATMTFIESVISVTNQKRELIWVARRTAIREQLTAKQFPMNWKVDSSIVDTIQFHGFEAEYSVSNVTNLKQLHYNRQRPFVRSIPYYNHFIPEINISKPVAYIIPQAWKEVIQKMKLNGVVMTPLKVDSVITVSLYHIDDFKTETKPFEGHYLHSKVKTSVIHKRKQYLAGDMLIYTNQRSNRYIIETLEPQSVDSWFAWGFFDAILQYKEHISDYVYEPEAEKVLAADPALKAEFEKKKSSDSTFAQNGYAMLDWIYRHSDWSESEAFVYPVGRIE